MPRRLAWIYVPNGANMADWTPQVVGADYELPMILEPLAAHRRELTVVSSQRANPRQTRGPQAET